MDIQKMMQQAQQVQEKMQEMQAKMGDMIVTGSAGGGMVKVEANCKGELISIKLDPSVVDPSEIEMLEDLIKAAINEARMNAEGKIAEETQAMMQDLGLPPGALGGLPM